MRPWRAFPRATLVLLTLAGVVLVVAGCAVLDDGPSETPRQRADRALRDIRESKGPEVRMRAAESLGDVKLPEAVDPLLQALRDPDPRVRRRVADALEKFEDAAPAIVPSLTAAAVAETNAPARVEMGWALKKLKAAPDTWVPAFRAGLADPDPLTRHNAAVGLVGQAPALDTFPPLFAEVGTPFGQELTERPQSIVRRVVEQSNDRRLIPLLLDGLKTGNPPQRALAAQALGLLKPPPREAIAPLGAALRDPEVDVRTNAVYTLTRLGQQPNGGPGVTPAILGALKDPEPGVRKVAASAFRSMEAPPRSAIPVLVETLRDGNAEVRAEAAFGLMGFYSPPAREAVPALSTAFARDPDHHVRINAARALGLMGPVARDAVPALRAGLRDEDERIRAVAAEALQTIEPRR
jgi:HEAT repeat protein